MSFPSLYNIIECTQMEAQMQELKDEMKEYNKQQVQCIFVNIKLFLCGVY